MDWKEVLGSLLCDVVKILHVGIWGPGCIYVKGCRHVKMYQVLCHMCYNNENLFIKDGHWGSGLLYVEPLVPGWTRLFVEDDNHLGPLGIRT